MPPGNTPCKAALLSSQSSTQIGRKLNRTLLDVRQHCTNHSNSSASLRRLSFVRSIFLRAITAGLYPNDAALTRGIADVRRQIVDATQGAPKYSRRVRLSTASGSVGHERNRLFRCFVG